MGILDRLRSRQTPKPVQSPRAGSGRGHTSGFLELEELNTDLAHPNGCAIYDRMYRTDGDVRRVMGMTLNPIIGGTWEVEPYGGDDATDEAQRIAKAVRWALFDFMRPGFTAHLSEALPLFTRHGFGPFEQVWARGTFDGQELLAPRKLLLMLPRTIEQWHQDKFHDLASIVQYLTNGGTAEVPAADLVYYRVGAEGDNWEGVSLLRPAYKHWYLKDQVERLDAIAQEREAIGIPVVYPPQSAVHDQATLDAVETLLQNLGTGDQRYMLMPGPRAQDVQDGNGWHFEIEGFGGAGTGQGAGRSAQNTLKYHSDKIAAAFIAEFMRLGQAGEGARATADVQQDPFHAAVEALAGVVEDEINDTLVARFVALNFGEVEGLPRLRMSKADSSSLCDLSTFVKTLVDAQALHPDNDLEDFLRERGDLPPADPQAREQREQIEEEDRQLGVEGQKAKLEAVKNGEQPDPDDDTPAGRARPKKPPTTAAADDDHVTFARQQRDLRWWEQTMSLDAIETSIDEARARFEAAGGDQARALAKTLAEAAAEGHDLQPVAPDGLVDALHGELVELYAVGRDTVRQELARQEPANSGGNFGASPELATFARDDAPDSLRTRARTAAQSIVNRIWRAIVAKHQQGHTDTDALEQTGQAEAGAAFRAEAQLHAGAALGQGRSDEADDQADRIAGVYLTSILDGNRCEVCADADDDVRRPMTDPVRLSRVPPLRDCHGGDRCRCMEFFVLKDEGAPSA